MLRLRGILGGAWIWEVGRCFLAVMGIKMSIDLWSCWVSWGPGGKEEGW